MKSAQKLISLFLSVLLLVSVVSISAFAEEDVPSYYNKYDHYTYFGDSVAAGVAVGTAMDDTYARMGFMRIQNCYTDLVADAIGYEDEEYNWYYNDNNEVTIYSEVSPSANVGVRVCDLRMLLEKCMVLDGKIAAEDAFVPVGDTYYETNGSNYASYFDYWTSTMVDRAYSVLPTVKDSDLFTIGLGSNDIFTCPITLMMSDPNFMNILTGQGIHIDLNTEDRGFEAINENLSAIFEAITSSVETLNTFLKYSKEGLSDIYNNYAALIEDIRAMNENDADIILVGLYNPFNGMKVTPNSNNSVLCDAFNVFTGLVNDHIAGIANKYDGVYFVDVSETESLEMANKEAVLDGNLWSIFTDIHPSHAGHRYMADQILNKLEAINKCSHEHTSILFEKKATIFNAGYSGDIICTDCGEILQYGEITTYKYGNFGIPRNTIFATLKLTIDTITNGISQLFKF